MNQTSCITPYLPSLQQLGLEEFRRLPISEEEEIEHQQMREQALKISEILREMMERVSAPVLPEPFEWIHFSTDFKDLMEKSPCEASHKRKCIERDHFSSKSDSDSERLTENSSSETSRKRKRIEWDRFSSTSAPEFLTEKSQSEASHKKRRKRLNNEQTYYLIKRFKEQPYPVREDYKRFSEKLNIPVIKLQQWFQNRRARIKKLGIE